MVRKHLKKRPLQLNTRQFLIIVFIVFMVGSIGLTSYIYTTLGDEYGVGRSTTITGRPKFFHAIPSNNTRQLSKPLSVTVAGKNVYVADSGNGKLAIYTKKGSAVKSFRLLKEAVPYPFGIARDDEGRLYTSIEVQGYNYIMVVDSSGKFLYRFPGEPSDKSGQPIVNNPMGLFYYENKLYVTDVGDHDVKVFSLDGKLLKKFGRSGRKKGEFLFPHGITADEDSVYVVDSNNSRVQVFDKDGVFKYQFGQEKPNSLVIPRGIAIDSLGRVHVVDLAQQKVFVFSKKGKFLMSYGGGKGKEALSYPNGIAIDQSAGLIYVADRQNDRIAVFVE
ncbi:MAG: 6-bladed beta-propeller [Candidatus Aquicultorales bacterium]